MKKNTKISITCGVMALALVAGSSFAYFTDRAETGAKGQAGTVRVDLTEMKDFSDGETTVLNPGDSVDASMILSNTGSKSIDVRTTIKLTSSVPMTDADGQCEYELYNTEDALVSDQGFIIDPEATPIGERVVSEDGLTITYTIPEYTLDGSVETGDGEGNSHTYDYVLVFRGDSKNSFQESTVTVDVLAEAKQHRNTTDETWETVASEHYTVGAIDSENVVPAA